MKINRNFMTVLAAVALFTAEPAKAQIDAGAGATLGTGLGIAMEKAQELIRKAKSAGNDLELQAGLNVQNAVSAMEAAYANSLNKTIAGLQGTERRAYTDLDNLLAKAQTDWEKSSADITRQAVVFANTLPFAHKFPQVSSFSPGYADLKDAVYELSIHGNFPLAPDKEHRPSIEINGKHNEAVEATTVLLKFDIPREDFGRSETNGIGLTPAILHIPWDSSGFLNPFRSIKDGVFTLQLAALPEAPGTLTIYHEVQSNRTETSTRRSGSFLFDSHADDIEENRSLDLNDADWAAGWRIVQNSGYFILDRHIEGSEGHDWYNKGLQGQNDRTVIWRVRTEHKGFGSSGKIQWGIGASVTRVVSETVQRPETVSLAWGARKVFSYPAGTWKAVWTRFDGKTVEYNSTDVSNVFMQLSATGDSFTVATFGL